MPIPLRVAMLLSIRYAGFMSKKPTKEKRKRPPAARRRKKAGRERPA